VLLLRSAATDGRLAHYPELPNQVLRNFLSKVAIRTIA